MAQRTHPGSGPGGDSRSRIPPWQIPLWFVALVVLFHVLHIGQALLIPLILALFLWYLITGLANAMSFRVGRRRLPLFLRYCLAGLLILGLGTGLVFLISDTIKEVQETASAYQGGLEARIENSLTSLLRVFGMTEIPDIQEIYRRLSLQELLTRLASTLGGLLTSVGAVLIYLTFLFIEQRTFPAKLRLLFPRKERRREVSRIISEVATEVRRYVGSKAFAAAIVALLSYGVMRIIGVPMAEFWAILIFFFDWIPYIGGFLAALLPGLLAWIQFPTIWPAIFTVTGISVANVIGGSIIEPLVMGRSLNLSPLVLILSLALWGALWGIGGAILAIPLTMVILIACAQFPITRPVTILFSQNAEAVMEQQRNRRKALDD